MVHAMYKLIKSNCQSIVLIFSSFQLIRQFRLCYQISQTILDNIILVSCSSQDLDSFYTNYCHNSSFKMPRGDRNVRLLSLQPRISPLNVIDRSSDHCSAGPRCLHLHGRFSWTTATIPRGNSGSQVVLLLLRSRSDVTRCRRSLCRLPSPPLSTQLCRNSNILPPCVKQSERVFGVRGLLRLGPPPRCCRIG